MTFESPEIQNVSFAAAGSVLLEVCLSMLLIPCYDMFHSVDLAFSCGGSGRTATNVMLEGLICNRNAKFTSPWQ